MHLIKKGLQSIKVMFYYNEICLLVGGNSSKTTFCLLNKMEIDFKCKSLFFKC